MEEETTPNKKILICLKDMGCNEETINEFMHYYYQNNIKQQIRILSQCRIELLKQTHEVQKKLDCLDFVLYDLKKCLREKGLK